MPNIPTKLGQDGATVAECSQLEAQLESCQREATMYTKQKKTIRRLACAGGRFICLFACLQILCRFLLRGAFFFFFEMRGKVSEVCYELC